MSGDKRPADSTKYVEFARYKYALPSDNDIEIDDGAAVQWTEEGYWVSAWVWVSDEDVCRDA